MKILFDHQTFSNQKYGGISRYFANLLHGVKNSANVESKLGLLVTGNAYIDKKDLPFGALPEKLIKKKSRQDKYNKWYSEYLLKQGHFDVFHPTYYHPYFLRSCNKPFVLTVHDMIHELYPDYFAEVDPLTPGYKAETIMRADHIIAISECTKRDLQRFYPIPDDKITVVHHGYKMNKKEASASAPQIGNKYILFVGDRAGYKNFDRFINAVSKLLKQHNLLLICAGGGSFSASEKARLHQADIADRVEQLSTSDAGLATLYKDAEAFVYPSLYEGFGLPVLEAFANNCPVILSNASSFPEVGGNAVQYFDPLSEESITTAIESVISNRELQSQLKAMGSKQVTLFNFDNTLAQTINVYKKVMR